MWKGLVLDLQETVEAIKVGIISHSNVLIPDFQLGIHVPNLYFSKITASAEFQQAKADCISVGL
jgi:hypothetical protein